MVCVVDGERYAGSSDSAWHAISWAWQEYLLRDLRPIPARGTNELPGDRLDLLLRARRSADMAATVADDAARRRRSKRGDDHGDSDELRGRPPKVSRRGMRKAPRPSGTVPELPGVSVDATKRRR